MRRHFWACLIAATTLLALPQPALMAQGTTGPVVRDTNVGYIDPAIPGDVIRTRVDASYGNVRPTRADFFWSAGGPFGRGPSIPESNVDYQDIAAYFEALVAPALSTFVNVPVRFLDPEQNPNAAGLSDMDFGLKWAFVHEEDLVVSFQFRTYVPTADVHRGLGNGHVSLEPALLAYKPLSDRFG